MFAYFAIFSYFSCFSLIINGLLLLNFLLFVISYPQLNSSAVRSVQNIAKLAFLYIFILVCVFFFLKLYCYSILRLVSGYFVWYSYFGICSVASANPGAIYLPLFSDAVVFLAIFLSLFCWVLLSERSLLENYFNLSYFTVFIFFTTNMVYSVNLLHMFLFFEFLFLPSLYFVYILGYSKRVDRSVFYLLTWTYLGSLISLVGLIYIYSIYKSCNILLLLQLSFSTYERTILFWCFFLGFGVKVPLWPFHYWLTKVHVEAPAGFSVFLSGFLVKTALYCLYFFTILFTDQVSKLIASVIIFWGFLDASIRMWAVQDIKKLIAFATIQEMNLILLFLFLSTNHTLVVLNLFIVVHGLLSGLLFFLVDQVQKRAQTRDINILSGFAAKLTILPLFIWLGILVFRGFPLFIKFFIEWELLLLIFESYRVVGAGLFLVGTVISIVGFARAWLTVLYGQPRLQHLQAVDMLKKDIYIASAFIVILFYLNFYLLLF